MTTFGHDDILYALAELEHGMDDLRHFQRPHCLADVLLEGRDHVMRPCMSLGIDSRPKNNLRRLKPGKYDGQ